jgi:hypothetical protein
MNDAPGKKHHAKRVLSAKAETEVTTALDELARTYDVDWTPIGGQRNNYGVVENQSSSPLGALNEIISNGIDAILRRRYRERHGSEYQDKHNLTSYAVAGDELLEGTEEVRIIADGGKGTTGATNITVRDNGEGQSYADFAGTFVGLLEPGQAKQGWPFLQGQFGMGSTAVLPHCGERGYKAIFSAGIEQPGYWTWTVVRCNRDGNAYEYLTLDGALPGFNGELGDSQDVGTFIKMFDYDLPAHSNITSGLRYKIARTMTEVPVPILLDERRDYQSAVMQQNVVGFKELIARHSEYVHRRKTRTYDFGGELGKRDVEVIIFKSDDRVRADEELKLKKDKRRMFVSRRMQRDRAIFFTVNGQVHGDKGLSFIKNRCDKYHISKDTVAFVDFSDLGPAQLTDLFTPARDRLQDKQMAKRLESGMQDLITEDPMLVEEEQRRREQFTKDKRDEKMGDMLDELVERNPALLDFLEDGEKVTSDTSGDGDERDDYEAPFFPDTLSIIDDNGELWDPEEDGRYEVEVPVDGNGWISFYLNAPDNFFTRDEQPGTRLIEPQDVYLSDALSRGTWTVQLQGLEAAQPGMTLPVQVDVGAEGMAPLTVQFNVTYVEQDNSDEGSTADDDLPPLAELDFPDIVAVYEEDWDSYPEPFDVDTPVRLAGSGSNMQILVNFDAAPIRDFLSRYNFRKTGKEAVKETWEVGVAMYALSTYIEVEDEFSAELVDPDHIAEVSMRGITQSMLDQQIGEDELEALTV